MNKRGWAFAFFVLGSVAIVPTAGCGKADDGLNKTQQDKAERLDKIAKASDGDWDKVPQSDRDYILTTFASGNEQSARMLLLVKSGKMKARPGAPKR